MVAALHASFVPQAVLTRHLHVSSQQCRSFCSPSRTFSTSFNRAPLQYAAAVDAPSAPPSETSTVSAHSTPEDLRAHLIKKGWQRAWLDGIQERQAKGEFTTTVERAEQLISSLESQGIPQQSICNMASMVPKILGVEESAARELVKYFKGKGFSDAEIVGALQRHPKLLTFSIKGQGPLENGKMRAEVGKDDAGRVWVNLFREGAFRKNPPQ